MAFHKNIEELVKTLRQQRHDFLDHLQIIYNLARLEDHEGLIRYVEGIIDTVGSISNLMTVGETTVSALLLCKAGVAESKGISFEVEARADLEGLRVKPWELTKILGNLIQNALEAVESMPPEKRKVLVEIDADETFCYVRVKDSGPGIPVDAAHMIFQPSFTTRGGAERGMGLSIVKETVERYNGTVTNYTDPGKGTAFTVVLPKGGPRRW